MGPVKSAQNRSVPLAPNTSELLKRLKAEQEGRCRAFGQTLGSNAYLFPHPEDVSGVYVPRAKIWSDRLKDFLDAHPELPRFLLKNLRDVAPTNMLQAGYSPKEIILLTGHSNTETLTKHYAADVPGATSRLMNDWAEMVESG